MNTTAVMGGALRPSEMIAKPISIDPAFDDPDAVVALSRASAPYKVTAAIYDTQETGKDEPWFRVMWARNEQILVPGVEFMFYNERFIEAAKKAFDASIIIPTSLMNNLNAPMAGGFPHLDLPYFRGTKSFPFDMLIAMRYSNLFHQWALPVASAICWFYRGIGGDFDYWPDGPLGSRHTIAAPLWNFGVMSDNEYMFHRIGPIGREEERLLPGTITRHATLHTDRDNEGWTMKDGENTWHYRPDQIRLSVLWKAYAFKDKAQVAEFRDPSHHLTLNQAMKIMDQDLRERGIGELDLDMDFSYPHNRDLIVSTYNTSPHVNEAY